MSDLTKVQENFLERHQISSSSIFDATGQRPKNYKAAMRKLGKVVAFGVTPCKKYGHRLRNRSVHCIQCNPASIAFQARHTKTGFVYVAGSKNLRLIKIGFSSNVDNRMDSLNFLNYASTSDWICLYWTSSEAAGKLEYESQNSLKQYMKPTSYLRDGYSVRCLETFACSVKHAIKAIESLALVDESEFWKNASQLPEYEFQSEKNCTELKDDKPKVPKQKKPRRKVEKQAGESIEVAIPNLKKPQKSKIPVVKIDEINTHPVMPLSDANQVVSDAGNVNKKSRLSPVKKIIFYCLIVLLFSVASSFPHISRMVRHNADVIEANAPKDSQLRQERTEEIQVKTVSIPSEKHSRSPKGSYEANRGLSESLTQSISPYPIKEDYPSAIPAVKDLGEYIGKNRLNIRIEQGAPIHVTEADDFILWHYQDFKAYIKKSDNIVARISEEPSIWSR